MEHRSTCINNKDEKSALGMHVRDCSAVAVGDFDVAVLERAKNAVAVVACVTLT